MGGYVEKKTERASQESDARSPRRAKKPYEKPVLTEYGTVAKLTRNTSGSVSDGGGGGMMMVCL
jgi:hypothetical protein